MIDLDTIIIDARTRLGGGLDAARERIDVAPLTELERCEAKLRLYEMFAGELRDAMRDLDRRAQYLERQEVMP